MKRIALAIGVIAASAFFVGLALDLHLLRIVTKPWPVLALMVWVLKHGRWPYARYIAVGLGLSAVGDVLLEISEQTFLPGVGAFLLAHVAYIAAFIGQTRRPALWWALPFGAWGIVVVTWLKPGLQVAGMLLPVSIYTAVICSMLWRAAACLGAEVPLARMAFTGALLFAASDTLIAISRFSDVDILGVRWWIMILYWLGQGLIASSARADQ